MPILALDRQTHAILHQCDACTDTHPYLFSTLVPTGDTVTTPPCPRCGACESLRMTFPDHELGLAGQPGSLVGTRFPDTGGVVREHQVGFALDPNILAIRRLHRQLAAALQGQGPQGQGHTP